MTKIIPDPAAPFTKGASTPKRRFTHTPTSPSTVGLSVLDDRTFAQRQSRHLQRLLRSESGQTLRLDIKRDSYDFQSHARIELWSPSEGQWHFVYGIPYPQMACVRSAAEGQMERDVQELIRLALLIIA